MKAVMPASSYTQQSHATGANPLQNPSKVRHIWSYCKGLPRQVNFLIDEAVSTGKGANMTISYVYFYFQHHGLGETDAHLSADNCTGQNKNSYFLWYLAKRTLMKLHHSITYRYSFLIAGHTKFGSDRCFGKCN